MPGAMVVVERGSRGAEPLWPRRVRATAGRRSTARPCSGTFTQPRPSQPSPASRRRPRAPRRLPRVLRPGHQRAPRHRPPGRRGCSTRSSSRSARTSAKNRLFDADERIAMMRAGLRRPRQRLGRGVHRVGHDVLRRARRRGDRQGPASRQRLRLRAPDGTDELLADRGRDGLHPHQPRPWLRLVVAGQGGRRRSAATSRRSSRRSSTTSSAPVSSPDHLRRVGPKRQRNHRRVVLCRLGEEAPEFCTSDLPGYDTRRSVVTRSESDALSKLDPRAPLVLDTRELGRRPGSQREVSRTVPAPADLGIEVLGVPEGSPVEVDLRLEAVMEGVLVTGTASAASRW